MCFVWIWEQTAMISLYSINWLVFITRPSAFTARYELGLWINSLRFVLKGFMHGCRAHPTTDTCLLHERWLAVSVRCSVTLLTPLTQVGHCSLCDVTAGAAAEQRTLFLTHKWVTLWTSLRNGAARNIRRNINYKRNRWEEAGNTRTAIGQYVYHLWRQYYSSLCPHGLPCWCSRWKATGSFLSWCVFSVRYTCWSFT